MTNELLKKAKNADSPEELLKLAKESGMEDFTEENAKAYFENMHRSGELSDDELESAAGGCKDKYGRRIVTLGNVCVDSRSFWRCKHCLHSETNCRCNGWNTTHEWDDSTGVTMIPKAIGTCSTCGFCSYESAVWYCNNEEANKR